MLGALPTTYAYVTGHTGSGYVQVGGMANDDECRCRGSACSLWFAEPAAPSAVVKDGATTSGRGCCAENTAREPWQDPAGGPP